MSDPVSVSIVLSDLVITEQGSRKNSLIGCFHNFNSPFFPFQTPFFFITVALTNLQGKATSFQVTARIEDPLTKHVLASVNGSMNFPEDYHVPADMVFEIPFVVPPFLIPKAGVYDVNILVNGDDAGKRRLNVNALTANLNPPPPAPPPAQ